MLWREVPRAGSLQQNIQRINFPGPSPLPSGLCTMLALSGMVLVLLLTEKAAKQNSVLGNNLRRLPRRLRYPRSPRNQAMVVELPFGGQKWPRPRVQIMARWGSASAAWERVWNRAWGLQATGSNQEVPGEAHQHTFIPSPIAGYSTSFFVPGSPWD